MIDTKSVVKEIGKEWGFTNWFKLSKKIVLIFVIVYLIAIIIGVAWSGGYVEEKNGLLYIVEYFFLPLVVPITGLICSSVKLQLSTQPSEGFLRDLTDTKAWEIINKKIEDMDKIEESDITSEVIQYFNGTYSEVDAILETAKRQGKISSGTKIDEDFFIAHYDNSYTCLFNKEDLKLFLNRKEEQRKLKRKLYCECLKKYTIKSFNYRE